MNSAQKWPLGSDHHASSSKHVKSQQKTIDTFFSPRSQGSAKITTPKKIRPSFQPATAAPQSPASSRIEVVLGSTTPGKRPITALNHSQPLGNHGVASDMSPQSRRLAAQAAQPVSLSNPVSPAATRIAKSSISKSSPAAAGSDSLPAPATAPKRKPGRPKGYRPSLGRIVSESEAAAAAAAAPQGTRKIRTPKVINYYTGRRRGRPPKPAEPKPREVYETLAPRFVRFVCEWEGCRAELHNFETLRRHVKVVHARAGQQGSACRWARCKAVERRFSTAQELAGHLEEVHMPPIVWQAGEGPVITVKRYVADDGTGELPDYLFDKTGTQVTPSIRNQESEDLLTYRANRKKLKALLMLRDQNLASDPESGEDGDGESPAA